MGATNTFAERIPEVLEYPAPGRPGLVRCDDWKGRSIVYHALAEGAAYRLRKAKNQGAEEYLVRHHLGRPFSCTCKDHQCRKRACKHFAICEALLAGGSSDD